MGHLYFVYQHIESAVFVFCIVAYPQKFSNRRAPHLKINISGSRAPMGIMRYPGLTTVSLQPVVIFIFLYLAGCCLLKLLASTAYTGCRVRDKTELV